MDIKELIFELTNKLKITTIYNEFTELLKTMEENNLDFYGKRRGLFITGFSQDVIPSKIEYLYDDGESTGKCYIKNFYKIAKIR